MIDDDDVYNTWTFFIYVYSGQDTGAKYFIKTLLFNA
jgi:hypothetical protein